MATLAERITSAVTSALTSAVASDLGSLPGADPQAVGALLVDLGYLEPGWRSPDALSAALREFQRKVGLRPDGIAGVRTTHALARYGNAARLAAAVRPDARRPMAPRVARAANAAYEERLLGQRR